jgi:hypothetical protein
MCINLVARACKGVENLLATCALGRLGLDLQNPSVFFSLSDYSRHFVNFIFNGENI